MKAFASRFTSEIAQCAIRVGRALAFIITSIYTAQPVFIFCDPAISTGSGSVKVCIARGVAYAGGDSCGRRSRCRCRCRHRRRCRRCSGRRGRGAGGRPRTAADLPARVMVATVPARQILTVAPITVGVGHLAGVLGGAVA